MTAPTPPIRDVVNDPDYVPIAASANGDVLVTEDGTVLIVSSILRARSTHLIQKRVWLKAPPFYGRVA